MVKILILISSLLLLVSACSQTLHISRAGPLPRQFEIIKSQNISNVYSKALYSGISSSVYLLNKKTSQVDIYRNGKFYLRIGGAGFNRDSFKKLSDICLGLNGELYALDSFKKEIKQFDKNGSWVRSILIPDLSMPELIEQFNIDSFYIYDRGLNEIVIYNHRDNRIILSFGKFDLINPLFMSSSKNTLAVFDKTLNKSFVYNKLGKIISISDGFIFTDTYGNRYSLEDNHSTSIDPEFSFAFNHRNWTFANSDHHNYLVFLSNENFLVGRMLYD